MDSIICFTPLIVLDNYSHIGFKYINARPSIRPKRELLMFLDFFVRHRKKLVIFSEGVVNILGVDYL